MNQWPYDAIDNLCSKVGLVRVAEPASIPEIDSPAGLALWSGAYAKLLLWPVPHPSEPGHLRIAAILGQDWLDHVLLTAEESGPQPVDGYLILLLDSIPTAEEKLVVQALEDSTQVCRKHVVWPDPTAYEGWHGLLDITLLPPPDAVMSETDADWPTLDQAAELLWHRVADLGHTAAAQLDLEAP